MIQSELNTLQTMPPWGRPQGDDWDRLSNFIYKIKKLAGIRRRAQAMALRHNLKIQPFENYAIRRWYNHHTHNELLKIFCAHPDVQPEKNPRHRTIDFYLRDIPFDLKISRFPKAYPHSLTYAWQHRHHLALWQYENQSQQGRYHTGHRLFVILYHRAQPELTWQLRREFATLELQIKAFLDAPVLLGLSVTHHRTKERHQVWAGIIFYVRGEQQAKS